MQYIIFDLEWNQPHSDGAMITEPVYLTGEIIEIGAVKLNEHFTPVDELRLYITPKHYTKMHRRIAALTGIHDRQLQEQGIPFPEAFAKFTDWCGEDYAYMTWSLSDMPMLLDNMLLHGLDISNLPLCYDIQRIFDREIMRSSRRYSLDAALEILGERGDAAHDALHDARNTAKICDHLDLETYLEEYATRIFAEPHCLQVYESPAAILADPQHAAFSCPWCGGAVTCEPWLLLYNSTHISLGSCEEGDEFYVELSTIRHQPGEFRARRMIYDMSDDLWEIYQDKKNPQPISP